MAGNIEVNDMTLGSSLPIVMQAEMDTVRACACTGADPRCLAS
jgi:hypothetical protein